jgi:hypothetical protein
MDRLNLTPKAMKILPVQINGKDYDLEIDTRNISLTSLVLTMADEAQKLEQEIQASAQTKDLETMRAVANKAIAKSDEFYKDFCDFLPVVRTATEGKPIRDFGVWAQLLFALANLITEGKAQTAVDKAIADEENDSLGA